MAKTKRSSGASKGPRRSAKASRGQSRKAGLKARASSGKKRIVTRTAKAAARRLGQAGRGRKKRRVLKKTSLKKKELEEFREMLLAKRRELVGDMSGMEEQAARQQTSGNLSSMPTHMADVGTDNFEHEFTLGLLESEQQLLREIDEAIRRIEDKTYGICLGTGQPIPKARLRAKPWATYTVEYTRMLEKGLVKPAEAEEEEPEQEEEEEDEFEEEGQSDQDQEKDAVEEDQGSYEDQEQEA